MNLNNKSFEKATPEKLYKITLASAQAKSKKVYMFENGSMSDLVGEKNAEFLRKEFLKNNVTVQQITNSPVIEKFSQSDDFSNNVMTFRYVPKQLFNAQYEICIFDNTVAIYNKDQILIIEDKAYAQMQRDLFLNIWEQGESPQIDFDYKPRESYYNSFDIHYKGIQIIVWPDLDAKESFKGMNQENIELYIQKTFDKYPKEYEGISYVICFLWSLDGKKMVDSWNFSANYVDDRSGPLSDNIVYEDGAISTGSGIASGSTLIILGYEEKLRRQSSNLENYLDGPLPKLPLEIVNGKDFFTDK